MIDIGQTIRANDIEGRNVQLFDKPDDVRWALETHAPEHWASGKFDAVIMTGNEDAPDAIYAADVGVCVRAVRVSDIFTRIA